VRRSKTCRWRGEPTIGHSLAETHDPAGEHGHPVEGVDVADGVHLVVRGPEDRRRVAVHEGARAHADLELDQPADRQPLLGRLVGRAHAVTLGGSCEARVVSV
jgi:hypothetical protein